jgi:predicted PurR-regulated permease PerM
LESSDQIPIEANKGGRMPDRLEITVSGKTIWQVIGAILLTLAAFWTLSVAWGVVSLVLISFFFSLALDPGVRMLVNRYGWRRGSAVGVIYLAGFVFVVFMIAVLIPSLAELARVIGDNGREWLDEIDSRLEDALGIDLISSSTAGDVAGDTDELLADWSDEVFGAVLGFASRGIGLIFSLATIAMFTFYLTAAAPQVRNAVLRLFSPNMQARVGWTWDQAIAQTGGYFYSRLILMFINGIGFFFTMVLVGMPTSLSISLALFGSFVSVFIPAIGTYIGGAVPVLLTLGVQGLTAGLVVLGYVLVYQQLENYWLSPKISAETMTLNGGVAFGAALAGGAIAGPMGAFTALPVAALISAVISNYYASHEVVYQSEPPASEPGRRKRRKNPTESKDQAD